MANLHILAQNGNIKGIKAALKNKRAFLSLDEDLGWSPLHYASNRSKAKAVQVMLDGGVSPNIKSNPPQKQKQNDWNLAIEKNGNQKNPIVYPMDVAEGPNRTKILSNLKKKGGKFYGNEMTLHHAVQMEDVDEIESLVEDESVKINGRDGRGWMPLHYAVELGNKEICELLLEHKANPNGSCHDGQLNPYEIALDNGDEELLNYLKLKGCKKNLNRNYKKHASPAGNVKVGDNNPKPYKEMKWGDEPKSAPTSLWGKMTESKSDKQAREEASRKEHEERNARIKEAADKAKEEEERLKKARVIKWKWGEDPFACKGDAITYDSPCESYTYFMDIVGYSKKSTAMQKKVMDDLIVIVKGTAGYQQAQRQGKLIILPTGDGMALVFFNSVHAAFKCAVDVGKQCYKSADIGLRNGLYTGPVVPVRDINNNPNVSGHGINMAQRCMDAGDNDHILISNGVYMNVSEMDIPGLKFEDWGQVFVKHGSTVHLHTAYGPGFGRTEFPDWRGTKRAEFKV
jgi:ankyrin repeat protein/class 3 adenylate cyclase